MNLFPLIHTKTDLAANVKIYMDTYMYTYVCINVGISMHINVCVCVQVCVCLHNPTLAKRSWVLAERMGSINTPLSDSHSLGKQAQRGE